LLIQGYCKGVDEEGNLILSIAGQDKAFASGEISFLSIDFLSIELCGHLSISLCYASFYAAARCRIYRSI